MLKDFKFLNWGGRRRERRDVREVGGDFGITFVSTLVCVLKS